MEARRGPRDHRLLPRADRRNRQRAQGGARRGEGPRPDLAGRARSDLAGRVVAGALAAHSAFLLQLRQHAIQVVRMIQLHLLAELGDLDPRVVLDELDGLICARVAPATASCGPARATWAAPRALAEAGERRLDLLPFVVQFLEPALEQRPGLIDCVRNPWHCSRFLSNEEVTVTSP